MIEIDGSCNAFSVWVSVSFTVEPFGAEPVADALLTIEPASKSTCVGV